MSLFLQALCGKLYQLQVILIPVDGILFCAMLDMVTSFFTAVWYCITHAGIDSLFQLKTLLQLLYPTLCIFSILMINLCWWSECFWLKHVVSSSMSGTIINKCVSENLSQYITASNICLHFEILPCSECCILSFRWFPGTWILYTNRVFRNVSI
jgi:hypothetical protein